MANPGRSLLEMRLLAETRGLVAMTLVMHHPVQPQGALAEKHLARLQMLVSAQRRATWKLSTLQANGVACRMSKREHGAALLVAAATQVLQALAATRAPQVAAATKGPRKLVVTQGAATLAPQAAAAATWVAAWGATEGCSTPGTATWRQLTQLTW